MNAEVWAQLVDSVIGYGSLSSVVWERPIPIMNGLSPFLGHPNIAFWSPDGYRNLTSVRLAAEAGCLELRSSVEVPSIVRPHRLTLQRVGDESFLLLELAELKPLGVCDKSSYDRRLVYNYEEVCELFSGNYADRDVYDEVSDAVDDLRANARVVTRWFGGQILVVSPGSVLNLNRQNDDGRLSSKTVAEIRAIIESALQRPLQRRALQLDD